MSVAAWAWAQAAASGLTESKSPTKTWGATPAASRDSAPLSAATIYCALAARSATRAGELGSGDPATTRASSGAAAGSTAVGGS